MVEFGGHQREGHIICAPNCEYTPLVSQPNKLVIREGVAKGNAEDVVHFKREEGFLYKISFPTLSILINGGGDHGEVINAVGRADFLISSGCREPFVLPNVNCFAISNTPSCAFPNNFETTMDTSPSIRGVAAHLGIDNIRKWEISCLVYS